MKTIYIYLYRERSCCFLIVSAPLCFYSTLIQTGMKRRGHFFYKKTSQFLKPEL